MNLEELNKHFGGKKVFLTGHTGFKGAWLLKILSMAGANVLGFSLDPKTDSDIYCLMKNQNHQSVIGDIRDAKKIKEEIIRFAPDFVFHLAAQPLVRLSYEYPIETYEINVIGTGNVLEGVKLLDNKCACVLITTDKVYHNNEWIYPYREEDRLGGFDPYSASKACAEILIDSYRNSFFNINNYNQHNKSITVARAGNVIGGGDWAKDRLIPDIARAWRKGEEVVIRNPQSVRPWQHVLEPVVGYLSLAINAYASPLKYSQAFNFGPNASGNLSVEDMVNLCKLSWPGNIYSVEPASDYHEANLLRLDISKVSAFLGWVPKLTAIEAVKWTMDWYKMFSENEQNIEKFTEMQIINYLNA